MKVGFVGMGNMGQLLVTALVRFNALAPSEIVVSNRSPGKLQQIAAHVPGIGTAYTNSEVARRCRVIFLCVKPGETREALTPMLPYITPEHLLVVINNTLDIAMLEAATPARAAKVIPTLLHAIGEGISLVVFGSRCTPDDKGLLLRLMGGISRPVVVEEQQVRVCSDLTSCGPAFLCFTFRALAQAARQYQPELGPDAVDALIQQTVRATCRMMEQLGLSFDDVIDRVSTPGGVTAEGLAVLEKAMPGLWEQVVAATIDKEEAKKAEIRL